MSRIRLGPEDFPVGRQLPWPVYDRRGVMMLREGSIIASERQRDTLLMRGAYRDTDAALARAARRTASRVQSPDKRAGPDNPLEHLYPCFSRLHMAFHKIEAGESDGLDGLMKLAGHLDRLYAQFPDAMVGAVHLVHEYDYVLCHPVHCAILCRLMADDLGFESAHRHSLLAAALAQNLGMFRLQERLQRQTSPLTEEQKAELRRHPERSALMLEEVGCRDQLCLRAIRQHHERIDGGGYPAGLKGEEVSVEAQLVSLSDRYGAMISARAYREALQPREVLREFYAGAGGETDTELVQRMIARLGVYPPGSFVRLSNGEEAVVIQRGPKSHLPVVGVYIEADGTPLRRARTRHCDEDVAVEAVVRPNARIAMELGELWNR